MVKRAFRVAMLADEPPLLAHGHRGNTFCDYGELAEVRLTARRAIYVILIPIATKQEQEKLCAFNESLIALSRACAVCS